MDLRGVLQGRHSKEQAWRSLVLKHGVGKAIRVDLIQIGMVVEPEIARIEPGGAEVHVGGKEQAEA